jgi:hypothetical protein
MRQQAPVASRGRLGERAASIEFDAAALDDLVAEHPTVALE